MNRRLGPEAAKNWPRRQREEFFQKYLTGDAILDIGYRGADPTSEPITDKAIGIDLDYPGYDGRTLPFPRESQDAIFASHVLEHIEDWAGALADWFRVLKIGGFLIIAVPHRDLYERKSGPPSRFNLDHIRFYTPASLLHEIEAALPVGGYRVRSLKDVDEGFDYAIPPPSHAVGCYEIELVVEKIRIPDYAEELRSSAPAVKIIALYARLVREAVRAWHEQRVADFEKIEEILSWLPLPTFAALQKELTALPGPPAQSPELIDAVRPALKPRLERHPFDENWYLETNPDVAKAARDDPNLTAHLHFIWHGYFEGRTPTARDTMFR